MIVNLLKHSFYWEITMRLVTELTIHCHRLAYLTTSLRHSHSAESPSNAASVLQQHLEGYTLCTVTVGAGFLPFAGSSLDPSTRQLRGIQVFEKMEPFFSWLTQQKRSRTERSRPRALPRHSSSLLNSS